MNSVNRAVAVRPPTASPKEATEVYYRRLNGLQAAAKVFEATGEPDEVLEWAQRYEHYLDTGMTVFDDE